LFWDSCVVTRYLTESPKDYVADIGKFISEARAGKHKIWISTILYAEVRPSQLAQKGFRSILDLIDALEGAFFPIGPTPPILLRSARLRDPMFRRAKPQKDERDRVLTVPDSIHLATCLYLKEEMGLSDIEFHTFDDGRGRNYEEKAVSLLRLHEYASHLMSDPDIAAVCSLRRMKPQHTQPSIL
jgi:hypothetical protein